MGLFTSNRINAGTVVKLTTLGKVRAEECVPTKPVFKIMIYLSESGASTVKEISDGARLPIDLVEKVVAKNTPVVFMIQKDSDF